MKSKLITGLAIGLFATAASVASAHTQVITQIDGHNGFVARLPLDGSSCDPRVIAKNLELIEATNVLQITNLTPTIPANGQCYGPCQQQLDQALEAHCAKAEALAAIAKFVSQGR